MKNQLWHWFYHRVSHFYHKLHFQEVYVSRPKDDFWLKPHLKEKQKISAQFFFHAIHLFENTWSIYPTTGQLKWMKVRIKYLVKLSENFWKILSLSNSNFSDWKIKIKEKYKLWIVFDKVLQWVQYLYENFKLNLSFWSQ